MPNARSDRGWLVCVTYDYSFGIIVLPQRLFLRIELAQQLRSDSTTPKQGRINADWPHVRRDLRADASMR